MCACGRLSFIMARLLMCKRTPGGIRRKIQIWNMKTGAQIIYNDLGFYGTFENRFEILWNFWKSIWDVMGLLKIALRFYGTFENRFECFWNFWKSIWDVMGILKIDLRCYGTFENRHRDGIGSAKNYINSKRFAPRFSYFIFEFSALFRRVVLDFFILVLGSTG